ncbi:MAG: DUF4382 domain-containing protein [Bacteroidia bacterium]
MKKINILLSLVILIFCISSCKKDTETTKSYPYSVKMTDAPGPYTEVNIDLQAVEVIGSNGTTVMLDTKAGIYNLIDLSNGKDTLIANADLEDATVKQIRLILGPNSTVVVDGDTFPLSTPSAEQSGLKLQVHQTLQAGVLYEVLIDFDANQSIVKEGNGTYKLKPVLRTIETAISGSIKGSITPIGALATVTATSSTSLVYTSNVTATGGFVIMGLPAGIYSVTVTPVSPLNPVTKTNVNVTTGISTNIGVIVL